MKKRRGKWPSLLERTEHAGSIYRKSVECSILCISSILRCAMRPLTQLLALPSLQLKEGLHLGREDGNLTFSNRTPC